jgi:tripartite ATP-independent transporter DctM subunit
MAGIIVIVGFVILFVIGFPIAFALILPATIYIIMSPLPITVIAQRVFYQMDSFPLLAIPLFMFAGSIMNSIGVTEYIFNFAKLLVSSWRGGLAHVNIIASLIFSGTSGSGLADIGGLGRMEMKAMTESGYSKEFAAAITISSATVGPIFPPSIPLVLFGAFGSVPTVELLIAGIGPAIATIITLMILVYFLAIKKNFPHDKKRSTNKEKFIAFRKAFPALLSPVILIGGMLSGIFSPTEAAGITIIYMLIISIFIYRSFSLTKIIKAGQETVLSLAPLMIIAVSASVFVRVLTIEHVPQEFSHLILSISDNPIIVAIIVNVLILFIGCFLDMTPSLLLLTPLVLPALTLVGFDPVHVGVIVVYNLMIGSLTPPMGMSLFLISGIANIKIESLLKELLPFFIPLLLTLILITYWPDMVLWLVELTLR